MLPADVNRQTVGTLAENRMMFVHRQNDCLLCRSMISGFRLRLFHIIAAPNKDFLAGDPHDVSFLENRLGFSRFIPVIVGPSGAFFFGYSDKILDDVFSLDVLQVPLGTQEVRIVRVGQAGSIE